MQQSSQAETKHLVQKSVFDFPFQQILVLELVPRLAPTDIKCAVAGTHFVDELVNLLTLRVQDKTQTRTRTGTISANKTTLFIEQQNQLR